MKESSRSSEPSWKKNMISKLDNRDSVGLDVLAEVATVSNYITADEDMKMNDSGASPTQSCYMKNSIDSMMEYAESDSFLRKRKCMDDQNGTVVTDETPEYSEHADFGVDTSYQSTDKTKQNSSLPSSITLEKEIDYSEPTNFLSMLMDVLSSAAMESVITWLPDGNAFTVLNEEEFTKYVLPCFFELIRFESFVKRLYRWGFKSMNEGSKNTVFYHEYFLRDYPDLRFKIYQSNNRADLLNLSRMMHHSLPLNLKRNPNLLNSSEKCGMDWHRQNLQKNLSRYRKRSSSMDMSASKPNVNLNVCADTLIKNFFDRKMNKIRSQYVQDQSGHKKFKRHSIGF